MRTVSISVSDKEKFENFCAEHNKQVQAAIGQLSVWALSLYPQCSIHWNAWHEEFTAHYSTVGASPQRTYTIGAVWDPRSATFSFHS